MQPQTAEIWQGLLRARSRIPSDSGATRIVSLFAEHLISVLSWAPFLDPEETFAGNPLRIRLVTISKLWDAGKAVLTPGDLREASGPVLEAIVKANIPLTDKKVKDLWTAVCTELCVCGGSSVLVAYNGTPSFKAKSEAWAAIAESWLEPDKIFPWDAYTALLAVPFMYASPPPHYLG